MNENLRDALERAAGPDPHLDLTEQVWAQGRRVRRRRQTTQAFGGLAAAAVMVGAVWLGGGLLSDPEALPGPADPPSDPAVTSVEVDRTADEATEETTADETTADETTTDESTEDATMDDATTEDATTGEPALPIDPCTTPYPDPVLRAESLPDQTRDRAEEVLAAAADCDLDTLVALAQQDQTFLSFGVVSPEEAFAGEEGAERAAAIATVMTLFEPGQDAAGAPYRWPGTIQSEEDWVLVVESGLHTQDEVDLMRGSGMGYTGWRVGVDSGGTWMFMTAGD